MTYTTDLDLTQRLVQGYADDCEAWKDQHEKAMECFDCEDFLARGLRLFRFIESSDAKLREADALGVFNYSSELYEAVTELYRAWLIPCDHADAWIRKMNGAGYAPGNLAEFRDTCEQVRATLEDREWLANSEDVLLEDQRD
jgi:hypothetical protein